MKPIDQKIAILQHMGWHWIDYTTSRPRPCRVLCSPETTSINHLPCGEQISGPTTSEECDIEPPIPRVIICDTAPDLLNDLNALREVEKTLNIDQGATYSNLLWPQGYSVFSAITASAPVRLEALVRTLGLWEE